MKKSLRVAFMLFIMLCTTYLYSLAAVVGVDYSVEKSWVNLNGSSGDEATNPSIEYGGSMIAELKVSAKDGDGYASITAKYSPCGSLVGVFIKEINDGSAVYNITIPNDDTVAKIKMFLWDIDEIKSVSAVKSYTIDEFKNDIIYKIPQIEYIGNYLKRATFETATLNMFKSDAYSHLAPDYFVTDEVQANSGRYSLKLSGRNIGSHTLAMHFDDIDCSKEIKIKISCYLRNGEGCDPQSVSLQAYTPTATERIWRDVSPVVIITDEGWIKLEGEIDCSKYNISGIPYVQIVTRGGAKDDFYVDDFLVEANCEGVFYDDQNYTVPELDTGIMSSTPNGIIPKYTTIEENIASIAEIYKEYFKVGAAICDGLYNDENRYNRLIMKHFNSAVAEGTFKMQKILLDPLNKTKYSFETADKMMDFCLRNGIEDIAGHCLVWDVSSTVPYMKDENGNYIERDTILRFMKEYITKVMRHFEGDGDPDEYADGIDYSNWHVNIWEVVNEAASGDTADGYKTSGASWINAVGADYVDYAYQYASETGYQMDFRYNDYDEHIPKKRDAIYKLVKHLLDNGKKVDTIGLQSHYTADTNPASIKEAFNKFTSLGVKVDVSELDVSSYTREQRLAAKQIYEDGVKKDAEYNQVMLVRDLFDLFKEYSDSIDRVVLWTVSDRISGQNGSASGSGFYKTDYAGIFDRNYQAKPQYWAIADKSMIGVKYPDYATRTNLSWNFEDEATSKDVNTNYSLSLGKWTGYNNTRTNTHLKWSTPNYISLPDAAATDGIVETDGAPGSAKCVEVYIPPADISPINPPQIAGIRVKLSKDQLTEGDSYTLNFWQMNNKNQRHRVYAFFRRPDDPENLPNWVQEGVSALPWLPDDGRTSIGSSESYWKEFQTEIVPTPDIFDECGYTVLWIVVRPYNTKNASTGKYYQINRGESIFFDDITLIQN